MKMLALAAGLLVCSPSQREPLPPLLPPSDSLPLPLPAAAPAPAPRTNFVPPLSRRQVLLLNCVAGADMARRALQVPLDPTDLGNLCGRTIQALSDRVSLSPARPEFYGCTVGVSAVFTTQGLGSELEAPMSTRAAGALARCEALP